MKLVANPLRLGGQCRSRQLLALPHDGSQFLCVRFCWRMLLTAHKLWPVRANNRYLKQITHCWSTGPRRCSTAAPGHIAGPCKQSTSLPKLRVVHTFDDVSMLVTVCGSTCRTWSEWIPNSNAIMICHVIDRLSQPASLLFGILMSLAWAQWKISLKKGVACQWRLAEAWRAAKLFSGHDRTVTVHLVGVAKLCS